MKLTIQEQIERRDRAERATKMARTYLRKSLAYLYGYRAEGFAPGDEEGMVDGMPPLYEHQQLLDDMLSAAEDIVERLDGDFFEDQTIGRISLLGLELDLGADGETYNLSDDLLEKVNKVAAALETRRAATKRDRLVRKLENTTGRTPEEAAAYQAKADELRAGKS